MDKREERDPQFGTIFPPQRHQARCLRRRRRRCPFPFQLPRNTPLPSLSVYLSMDKRFPLDQEQEDKRSALEGRGPRFPNPACLSLCPPSRGRVTVMMRRRRRQCQTGKAWETTDDGRSRKIVYEDRLPFSPRARWAPTSCSVTCINYAPARARRRSHASQNCPPSLSPGRIRGSIVVSFEWATIKAALKAGGRSVRLHCRCVMMGEALPGEAEKLLS